MNEFKNRESSKFSHISSSQWGVLRNYATNCKTLQIFYNMVFDTNTGFMFKGQSEVDWTKKSCNKILTREYDSILKNELNFSEADVQSYFIRLANQMSKK